MLTETSDYATLYRDFRWDVPARFNIATACCDRHADGSGRLALIYVDEDGGTTRTSFDELLRDLERVCQRVEGRWARSRRPRRGVSVAVAGAAGHSPCRIPLRPGVGAAVHAVRRGCAGISPRQFRRQGGRDRRNRLGKTGKNPRPAAGAGEYLCDRRDGPGGRQIVLVVGRGRVGRISPPSIPRPTIPPSSSTLRAPPEIRKAPCTPIACCSVTCRTSRWCMISCRNPST